MQVRQLHYLSLIVVAQSEIVILVVALSLMVTLKLIYQYDSVATVKKLWFSSSAILQQGIAVVTLD